MVGGVWCSCVAANSIPHFRYSTNQRINESKVRGQERLGAPALSLDEFLDANDNSGRRDLHLEQFHALVARENNTRAIRG